MYARDHALIATPIGNIRIEGDDATLIGIRIGGEGACAKGSAGPVREAAEQLAQWFSKERETFALPLAPAGTARGEALRSGLIALGYGETLSYGALAQRLGSSPRAIGQLCARNPFPIVVPCHRVLGSGGALGAYSAGEGPRTKAWLLEHERRNSGGTLL
ncbi:methylated-DNA--[protein]-cysteine S-methyltransferase [Sphingomonas psychrotolerans]|uniref:Methylated-DNA--[protein]-cysteine S-methyltransferase n=1 Tax=Sphingomonas psychrotolerans TaxID=1327635 RepID=A0ABU3NBE8_9SPHN|nr:methylated-DNA--[protein]-cysteine S-methyltransferase [Sphingomonas psychrotolerans]MDT8760745.1 methylated-DNA--[protein]-cysteine S-methyltransferase [Sphingomonas psychrotolerans]